ncbi:MAG: hypothetical protein HQM08_25870 [Candidatus Riflebacteria bacterium]|nr:hypothetical protein [Candidatus Riflebacteria bacterium]
MYEPCKIGYKISCVSDYTIMNEGITASVTKGRKKISVKMLVCSNRGKLVEEKAFGEASGGKLFCGKIITGKSWVRLKLC